MSDDVVDWIGQSGETYRYHVHNFDWRPSSDQNGNYIFAKVVKGVWNAVYVGQGDLRDRYDDAINEGCVTRKGATHYHVHLNVNEDARRVEETDIINGNLECRWPVGCNGHD